MTSQATLYGEILTNEQRYRADIARLASSCDATAEQEQALLVSACAGNQEARLAIITRLLPQIERYARNYYYTYAWASHRIELLDMVQEGNETLLLCLDQALQAPNPYGYLVVCATRAIRHYCARFSSAILTPVDHEPLEVASLDAPTGLDDERPRWEAIEEDGRLEHKDHEEPAEKDYTPLYTALNSLSARAATVMKHHFGLEPYAPEPLATLDRLYHWPEEAASTAKAKALTRLYSLLAPIYPQWCANTKGVREIQSLQHTSNIVLTPEQEERLAQGHAMLQAQGIKLTEQALQPLAHMRSAYVRAYVRRYRASQPTQTREERLDAAYEELKREGKRFGYKKLAKRAHVSEDVAAAYARTQYQSEPTREDRLHAAYEAMQQEGGCRSSRKLAERAHVHERFAKAYLQALRQLDSVA